MRAMTLFLILLFATAAYAGDKTYDDGFDAGSAGESDTWCDTNDCLDGHEDGQKAYIPPHQDD